MNRIELAMALLQEIGLDVYADRALAQSAMVILGRIEVRTDPAPEPQPEPDPEPKQVEKPVKRQTKPANKRKPFDTGKMVALLNAGWSVAKIADEMGVSEQTVRNHMKEVNNDR